MKGSDAFYLMKKARLYIYHSFRENVCDVYLNPDVLVGNGETSRYSKLANVGVKEFVEHPDDDFSVNKVTEGVVALFHETYGHGLQYFHLFYEHDATSKALAFSDYACRGSAVYYGYEYSHVSVNGKDMIREHLGNKYFLHPHEMAAEYAGIKMAYQFFSQKYGPNVSNRLICNYVNHNVADDWSFVHPEKPYEHVRDIFQDFKREFPKCVLRNRDYDPHADFIPGDDAGGPLVQYASRFNKKYLLDIPQDNMDGVRQDAIQSAAVAYMPGMQVEMSRVPVFHNVSFDPKKMIIAHKHPIGSMSKLGNFSLSKLDQALRQASALGLDEPDDIDESYDDDFDFT